MLGLVLTIAVYCLPVFELLVVVIVTLHLFITISRVTECFSSVTSDNLKGVMPVDLLYEVGTTHIMLVGLGVRPYPKKEIIKWKMKT